MSEIRIGVAAEGPTDIVVIQAALDKIIDGPFVLTQLQPETSESLADNLFGRRGTGWGGVYQWCRQVVSMDASIFDNPSLVTFDAIIVHVYADVGRQNYAQANIQNPPKKDLPCNLPCPPASDTVRNLETVVLGWLNLENGRIERLILCIPSQSIESWIGVAKYGKAAPDILEEIECDLQFERFLAAKPAKERIIRIRNGKAKKLKKKYEENMHLVRDNWEFVEQNCPQALIFRNRLEILLSARP